MKALLVVIAAAMIVATLVATFAPASLVDARLATATGGYVRVAEADGTLWRGRGVVGASDGRWRVPVAWSLDFAPLLRGTVSATLWSEATPEERSLVMVSQGRFVVESLDVTLPGAVLAVIDPAAGVATGGELRLRATSLELAPSSSSGTITADWSNARAQLGAFRIDLGTVTLRLASQNGGLGGPLANTGGDVNLDGSVTLRDRRLDAQLRVAPNANAPPGLRNALASLGPADARGAVAIRIGRALR